MSLCRRAGSAEISFLPSGKSSVCQVFNLVVVSMGSYVPKSSTKQPCVSFGFRFLQCCFLTRCFLGSGLWSQFQRAWRRK